MPGILLFFCIQRLTPAACCQTGYRPGFRFQSGTIPPKDHKNKSVQKYPELKSILVRLCLCCSAEHIKNAEMETKDSVLNLIE